MKTSQAVKTLLVCATILASTQAFGTQYPIPSMKKNQSKTAMASSADGEEEKIKIQTWNPLRLLVLKIGLTEPAWTSPWNYQKKKVGTFTCAYCGQELFESGAKYDSGSGWPSFWRSTSEGSVRVVREWDGRVECSCSRCKSHLGHVFMDGPQKKSVDAELLESIPESDPKGRNNEFSPLPRFCVNGASLRFTESGSD